MRQQVLKQQVPVFQQLVEPLELGLQQQREQLELVGELVQRQQVLALMRLRYLQ
jgi:hypothetical protein